MTPIPPQAITAAIASLGHHHDVNLWLTAAEGTVGGLLARKKLLTRAVEAAAPHLATAHGHGPHVTVDPGCAVCQQIAQAVAAERERCAQHPHLLRALSDPGSIVPRGEVPTVNGTELESLPHWQMRAVAALLREAQP